MNPQFSQLVQNLQHAQKNSKILWRRKLSKFAKKQHQLFWSHSHTILWEAAMGTKPPVLLSEPLVGVACFPVYSEKQRYLIQFTVQEIDGEEDLFPNCFPNVQKSMEKVLKIVRLQEHAHTKHFAISWTQASSVEQEIDLSNINGTSLELALAIAVISVCRAETIPNRYVFTGEVGAGGNLIAVNRLVEKSQLLSEWRPKAILITPPLRDMELNNVSDQISLRNTWVYIQKRPEELSWGEKAQKLSNISFTQDYKEQIFLGEALLENLELQTLKEWEWGYVFMVLCRLIAAYNHTARAEEAMILVDGLQKYLEAGYISLDSIPDETQAELLANCATSFVDEFNFEEGLAFLNKFGKEFPRSRKKIHFQGAKASLLIGMGKREEGLALYQDNARYRFADEIQELPRTLAYVGNLQRLMNRLDEAEKTLQEGFQLENEIRPQMKSGFFLDWYIAKVYAARGEWDKITAISDGYASKAGFNWANVRLNYADDLSEITTLLKETEGLVPAATKMHAGFSLRAKILWYQRNHKEIPEALVQELRGLNKNWNSPDISVDELLLRIPY